MNLYRAVSAIEGFGTFADAPADDATLQEAWQFLIDGGHAWTLQGHFGRTAKALIEQGVCHLPEPQAA